MEADAIRSQDVVEAVPLARQAKAHTLRLDWAHHRLCSAIKRVQKQYKVHDAGGQTMLNQSTP